ncbi:MAG: nucleotidyltransferase domain-containing protein [Deltaproteobacteria bacterium]|nr:nucleotidyltransferase domain-containing protein [Deltaproteobacteria bacterium]
MIREGKKLPGDVLHKVPEIVRAVSVDEDIQAMYFFGSASDGVLHPLTDLDFGVLLHTRLNKNQRFEKHLELIGLFTQTFKTDEIDLLIMNDVPPRISRNIIKSGKRLFMRDKNALVDFSDTISKLYLDFKFYRDHFDNEFLKGIGYDG